MSVSMTFYSNFSKRENSTKQPSGGTSYDVVFKDAFSIIGGTVKLQVNFDTAKNYTAAKYGNNFYKVVDVVSTTNNIVEITLTLDVLATYKSSIASYTSMIERSPSDANIVNIVDNTIAPLPGYILNEVGTSLVTSIDPVVQLITKNNKGAFAYFFDVKGFQEFCEVLDWVVGSGGAEYIISSKICYLNISSIGTPASEVAVGKLSIKPVSGYSGVVRVIDQKSQLVPKKFSDEIGTAYVTSIYNDVGGAYTDERRYNDNYVELYLEINGQVTALDTNYLRGDKFLFEAFIDPISLGCMITTSIEKGSINTVINSTSTNIGVSFSFVSSANGLDALSAAVGNMPKPSGLAAPLNDAGNMASSDVMKKARFVNAGITSYKNNIVMAGASSLAAGIKKSIEINTSGGPSGSLITAKKYGNISLITLVHPSIPKNPDELGYPYMGIANINTVGMTGFYKFAAPQLSLSAMDDIKTSVNEYLANGFFYE